MRETMLGEDGLRGLADCVLQGLAKMVRNGWHGRPTSCEIESALLETLAFLVGLRVIEEEEIGWARDGFTLNRVMRLGIETCYGTGEEAEWRVTDLTTTATGVSFRLEGPHGAVDVTVPQPGTHIARNAAG
ncbi:hypothetical protein LCGC14_2869680, partial [marine sediment metagenome]